VGSAPLPENPLTLALVHAVIVPSGKTSTVRVAVVTGGSSGIGAATARALTREGWRCVLLARGEGRLRAVAEQIGAEWEVCDVADREAVEAVAARVSERHPAIGLLVNSAGIPGRSTFLRSDPELIERVMRVNYLGSVWSVRAFLPALEAASASDVVNIVSVAGTVALGRSGPYSASKHAQLAFSRSLTIEVAPRGIRVHTINPGFVETDGFPQTQLNEHPVLRRAVAEPELVAERVVSALERGTVESFVPRWYRPAAVIQAVMPGAIARAQAARRRRRARG
jgi:NAD(P)-dependent dehydrogenase (short-subunit alcohol dehydrogenase family)